MNTSLNKLRKHYISWEGVIRCGKTTQRQLFVERFKKEFPEKSIETSREPGGDQIAEVIRSTVQGEIFSSFNTPMTPECEALLYSASRAQTVPSIVIPALKRGSIFASDRSALTSIAYQGAGRGLGMERVFKINDLVLDGMWPGLGIVIDTDLREVINRARNVMEDKFEAFGVDFFKKAREGYLVMGDLMKGITRIEIVNGNGSIEEVHERVWKVVIRYFGI